MMAANPAEVFARDFVTVLTTAGPKLAKTFSSNGVVPYDDAKNFKPARVAVGNLAQLYAILDGLRGKPKRCVIRGGFVGEERAGALVTPDKEGYWHRLNGLYDETAHRWTMFDVDGYRPILADPLTEPEDAIREFIETQLPPCFHACSYIWHLSSSAGLTPGLLKVHLWFWIDTAYTGPQWRAWVRSNRLPIDVSPFRRVQIHYTSDPVFEPGVEDPVAQRMGLWEGLSDSVDLEIPESVMLDAAATSGEIQDNEYAMPDPREKAGVIGAFCRAFDVRAVIEQFLQDQYQFAVGSDRRVTWLNGGGTPEGCFITDDGLHLGSVHNTDPFENRLTNAFDLVRWFKFGAADDDLDLVTDVFTRPSYREMVEWATGLPEVRAEMAAVAEAGRALRDQFEALLRCADTESALVDEVTPDIRQCNDLTALDRAHLAQVLQEVWRPLVGTKLAIADARDLVRPEKRRQDVSSHPDWLRPWVYVTNGDVFFNLDTGEVQTRQGFDFAFARNMVVFSDENGNSPRASEYAASLWCIDVVARTAYNPQSGRIFECEGLRYANTYCSVGIPEVPPTYTASEEALIRKLEAHAAKLIPSAADRDIFLDWLAHNVQKPGVKIRWSPFLYGVPGAGKTLWHYVLMAAMGQANVSVLSSDTLANSPFNSWANESAVVTIEEIKSPDHSAREVENKLKEPISNPMVQIHLKGRSPFNVPNVTNYLLFSNWADGLTISEDDRRYLVLRACLSREEAKALAESGYFRELFAGIERHRGAVRKWLLERQLSPGFDADGRAPITQAKEHVIELSKSDTHLALSEILEKGAMGVTREIISSAHLVTALKQATGRDIFTKTINSILSQAGYHFHGRVKWAGDARRIWTLAPLGETSPDNNALIRGHLDAAAAKCDFDFLE